MDCSPASTMIATKGKSFHTLMAIIAGITVFARVSQPTGSSMTPVLVSM